MQNEDLDYISTDDDVEELSTRDPDTNNKSVLVEALQMIDGLIKKHSSIDGLNPNKKTQVINLEGQIYANKLIVEYLRTIKMGLASKIEELE